MKNISIIILILFLAAPIIFILETFKGFIEANF